MWPDPYGATIPIWLQIVLGVVSLGAAFLLIGHKRPDRVPSTEHEAPHDMTPLAPRHASLRRPFDWTEDDATVLDFFFEDAKADAFSSAIRAWHEGSDRLADLFSAPPRHLSVVDQAVQTSLRVPLREVTGSDLGGAA
jgi:hypothetical protein